MLLRDCQICETKNLPQVNEKDWPSCEQRLLDWVANNDKVFVSVSEKTSSLPSGEFRLFQIKGRDPVTGREYVGVGRSLNRLSAASIAAGEVLERMMMVELFRHSKEMLSLNKISLKNGRSEFQITSSEPAELPLAGFRTSNGWAVHFDLNQAIYSALKEALERHILLFTYLKYGWEGFNAYDSGSFEGHGLTSLIARVMVAGHKAGMGYAKSKIFGGGIFGYVCDKASGFEKSSRWSQAFFEAYDNLIFYEANGVCQEEGKVKKESDVIKEQMMHYLVNDSSGWRIQDKSILETHADLHANVICIDVAKFFGIPCPFYAAFVYGGDLLPLAFRETLTAQELMTLHAQLEKYGIKGEFPLRHPIL